MLGNRIIKGYMGVILSLVMSISIYGCGIVRSEPDEGTRNIKSSSLSVQTEEDKISTSDIRPQDDFYGYINKDILLNLDLHYGESYGGPAAEIMDEVDNEVITLISEVAFSNESFNPGSNEQLVKDAYLQYLNQDNRGSLAVEHFNKRLNQINAADSTDELLDIIGEIAYEEGQLIYFDTFVDRNFFDSGENALYIDQKENIFDIKLKDLYESDDSRQMLHSLVYDFLTSCGDEPETADKKADELVYFVIDIACNTDYQISEAENPYITFSYYSNYELDNMLQNISMDSFEQVMGITDNSYGGWYIRDEGQLAMLDELFTDNNLECIKSYIICELMYRYHDFLVDEYEVLKLYMPADYRIEAERAALYVSELLDMQVGELYAARYYTEDMDKQLTRMYEDIKEGYRELISEADWLSGATREGFIEKLDNMYFIKGGGTPHKVEVSDAELIGEDAFSTYVNIEKNDFISQLDMIGKAHDKTESVMPAHVVNSVYSIDNSFDIMVAIMHEPYFDVDADYYTNLGGLGMVVAHEMGHAFDSNCINYDADGNYNPDWISSEDRAKLELRMDDMIDYYSSFTIMDIYHVDGKLTCGENYADKGGMECLMKIAKTDEERQKIFENYAYIWCTMIEDTVAMEQLETDEHSPESIRVNAVLSSTDEFYELYDVKQGDGMYIAPKDRVSRW